MWGLRTATPTETYTSPGGPEGEERSRVYAAIRSHIGSPLYTERVERIKAANLTGIIVPSGGARMMTNLLVSLKVNKSGRLVKHYHDISRHVKMTNLSLLTPGDPKPLSMSAAD